MTVADVDIHPPAVEAAVSAAAAQGTLPVEVQVAAPGGTGSDAALWKDMHQPAREDGATHLQYPSPLRNGRG